MTLSKKTAYRKAFWWGNLEHKLESFTNWLMFIVVMIFWFVLYKQWWFLARYCFYGLVLTFLVHLLARFCHRREKKFHRISHL